MYMNRELLEQLGLRSKQIDIYIAIIEQGKSSPGILSKLTGISRPTVYAILGELVTLGLIEEGIGNTSNYFLPTSPKSLLTLLDKQELEIASRRKGISELIGQLQTIRKGSGYEVPSLRFIDEQHFSDFMYKQLPIWIDSAQSIGELAWWGIQDHTLVEQYPDWFDWHWKTVPRDLDSYFFTNKIESEIKMGNKLNNKRRVVKYWDNQFPISTTQAVLGDYILITQTVHRPHYAIEIHDKLMAHNMRQVFRKLWQSN